MLSIINYNQDEYDFPCLLVLGSFDAIHIGHAELLKKAKLQAKINGLDLGVMMFSDGKGGKQVYTFEERLKLLEPYNVKFVLKVDFTEEFKAIKPLDFLATLEDKLNVKAYMSGKDFRFGEKAKGKSSTLKKYADDEENSIWYIPVKDVMQGENKISTTWIKELLNAGKIKKANKLLGRQYSFSAEVVHGHARGAELGFPTINLNYPENKVDIKPAVYLVKCEIGGETYNGIANYGARPTFDEGDDGIFEVFLCGYSGECYGETVTVTMVKFIRDIVKFCSDFELKAQIEEDLLALVEEEDAKAEAAE